MNEEEKKTFRFLKGVYNLNFKSCTMEIVDIKNIISIIEKLQKEIEDLKTITREYDAYELGEGNKIMIASKEWFNNGYFKEHYISKDKIKEKIEDLRQYEKEIEDEKDFEYYATLRIINVLKKLLGGK